MKNDKQIFFSTFTVQNWVSVFRDIPESNSIILDSFRHLVKREEVVVYAFVIMRDHLHIVWEMDSKKIKKVSVKFKRYTGGEIIKLMMSFESQYLNNFISEKSDRKHKFWKAQSGCLALNHPLIVWQKINYTHNNPIKGNYRVLDERENYLFSSARSYLNEEVNYSFLTLYSKRT